MFLAKSSLISVVRNQLFMFALQNFSYLHSHSNILCLLSHSYIEFTFMKAIKLTHDIKFTILMICRRKATFLGNTFFLDDQCAWKIKADHENKAKFTCKTLIVFLSQKLSIHLCGPEGSFGNKMDSTGMWIPKFTFLTFSKKYLLSSDLQIHENREYLESWTEKKK